MHTPKGVTLWLALWRVSRDIDRIAQDDIARLGLCLTDFGVLEALLHRGPLRVNAIAETVMVTSGSMTASINRLIDKGLVARSVHEGDARVRMVALTDAGRALIEPAYESHARTIEATFAALSAEERSTLLGLLLKVRSGARAGVAR